MNFIETFLTTFAIILAIILFVSLLLEIKKVNKVNKKVHKILLKNFTEDKVIEKIYQEYNILEKFIYSLPTTFNINKYLMLTGDKNIVKHLIIYFNIFAIVTTTILAMYIDNISFITLISIYIVSGFILMLFYLKRIITKRQQLFLKQFPDALNLLIRAVMAGLPITAAFGIVAKTGDKGPVASELSTISEDISLGRELKDALQAAQERVGIIDFDFFVASITMQQRTGGNITEVLSNITDVIKSREVIAMKIQSSSAEARSGALVVGSLPFLIILALSVLRPEYVSFFIEDSSGRSMMYLSLGLLVLGILTMKKMINFDV